MVAAYKARTVSTIINTPILWLFFNLVSNSPHHLYIFGLPGIHFNLFPQVTDVYHDRIRVNRPLIPNPFIYLLSGEYTSRVLYQ